MSLKIYFFKILSILISLFFVLIILEVLCRNFIEFEKNYYATPIKSKDRKFIIHPYGKIPINKDGFYDEEFNFKNGKQKIAYFGDSVTYGVGAGYPYRFTEYLDKLNSNFDHLNFTGGLGISLNNWNTEDENFLLNNNINRIVYVMNLNDIAPLSYSAQRKNNTNNKKIKDIYFLKNLASPLDKLLRGKSMLYTYIRFKIKSYYVKNGFEASGLQSIELFPNQNRNHIVNAAKKINDWSLNLKKKGIKSCVIILPYEMQISKNAKNYYRSIGIKFEKEFENFLTQEILQNNLIPDLNSSIIKDGFLEKKIGYYFVFNKGDKIDFNHPNRKGHLVIAKEIAKNKTCQN